jgi:uncharacterized lipoprotein
MNRMATGMNRTVNMFVQRFVLLALAALLAACAQSPQRLNVNPVLTLPGDATGNGRAIIVNASDERKSKVLGSLGGIYKSTASVTIGNDIEQAMTRAANGLLAAQGYVVNSPDPSALQLTIVIENLVYEAAEQPVGSDVKMTAVLRADVTKGGETFSGRYQSESQHRGVARPDPEDNEKWLNELLSDTLTRMFTDSRLRNFFAK